MYRIEQHNLDGRGTRRCRVYPMPPNAHDYWQAVTDVPCPECGGTIRWHEANYVPGYRICDQCRRHFLARGTMQQPVLIRVGTRRG